MFIPFTFGDMLRQLVVVIVQDVDVGIELATSPGANGFRGKAWNTKRRWEPSLILEMSFAHKYFQLK